MACISMSSSLCAWWCVLVNFVCFSVAVEITSPNSNKLYTVSGGNFSIECELNRVGELNWYHNASRIREPYPNGVTITSSSSGLTQKSVFTKVSATEVDKGIYGCESAVDRETESVSVMFLKLKLVPGVALKPRHTATLQCIDPDVHQGSTSYTVQWLRDGMLLSNQGNKYKTHPENGSLDVEKVDFALDLGMYTCEILNPGGVVITSQSLNLTSVPNVHKFAERSKNLNKGSDLRLGCSADGYPEPRLYWQKDDVLLDGTDERIEISVDNKKLMIRDLEYSDRGMYYCFGDNGGEQLGNSSIMVRVKDPLAPLWPIIGILIEVAILAVIIIFHEWRKAQQKAREDQADETASLTDKNNEAGSARGGDDMEMRKRKT